MNIKEVQAAIVIVERRITEATLTIFLVTVGTVAVRVAFTMMRRTLMVNSVIVPVMAPFEERVAEVAVVQAPTRALPDHR